MSQVNAWQKPSNAFLSHLLPRLEEHFRDRVEPVEWQGYLERFKSHFPRLFRLLYQLYGSQYYFFYHLENISAKQVGVTQSDTKFISR